MSLKQTFDNFWGVRTAQEKLLLRSLGGLLAFALVYLVAIDPPLSNGPKLAKSLPVLRQQVIQMQDLVREAKGLNERAAAGNTPLTKEMVEASLAQAGLSAKSIGQVGDQVKLQLNEAPFANIVTWLDGLQKSAHVSVIESNLVAQSEPGIVIGSFGLYQPK